MHWIYFALLHLADVGQIVVDNSIVTINGANDDHLTISLMISCPQVKCCLKLKLYAMWIDKRLNPQQTVLAGLKQANELGGRHRFLTNNVY